MLETWPPNYVEVFAQRQKRHKKLRSNILGAKEYYRTRPVEFIEHWDSRRRLAVRTFPHSRSHERGAQACEVGGRCVRPAEEDRRQGGEDGENAEERGEAQRAGNFDPDRPQRCECVSRAQGLTSGPSIAMQQQLD